MPLHLTRMDKLLLSAVGLFVVLAALGGWLVWGGWGVTLSLGILFLLLLAVLLECHRRQQIAIEEGFAKILTRQDQDYRQMEALFRLYSTLPISAALPTSRPWPMRPDALNILIDVIREHRPRVVLELGTGLSTLVAAYCLKEIGAGRIVSLENLEIFATESERNLERHGLSEFVDVVRAPLAETTLGDESWRWYDTSGLDDLPPIDLLLVDGPTTSTGPQARYPALPIFFERLSKNAVVLLDDARQPDQRKILERWRAEFPGFQARVCDTETGLAVLRRTGAQLGRTASPPRQAT